MSLEADTLYAIILKGREFGETDRTLQVPLLGGLLKMAVYQDDTLSIGAFVVSGIDGLARVLFKPESSAVYQVVVADALAEYTGSYDLRVRPYEDDHFPNSIETESEISFPADSAASESFPSASATGKIDYALDHDWFKASGLVAGDEYVIEACHGRRFLLITIYDTDGNQVETGYEQGRTLFAVPANGDYFIRVYPANRFNRARYTLYVHTLPLAVPYVGSELSVSADHITDPDGVSRATAGNWWTYQWYKVNPNGFETLLPRPTSSTYTPTIDDVRQRVRAEICYRDDNSSVALECRSTRRSLPVQPLITVPHDWSSIPSGLNAGDRFRLLFVSKDKRMASANSIYTYRNWIRSQAENGHTSIRGYKDHFTVLGSTRGDSAKDHAVINFNDEYAGVPIYWLGGQKAADDYADFCDGSWDHFNPGTDSAGAAIAFVAGDLIYTGTLSTCEASPNAYLGTSSVTLGRPNGGNGSELQETTGSRTAQRRMYGLSYVFEVGEAQTSMQQQANSPAEGNVRIFGTPQVGQTLAANSAIFDPDGTSGADYAYQWYADDSEIAGATEILYTLTTAERGKRITVTITFTDDADNEETLTSEPTAAVTGLANNAATGQPTIMGTAQVGQTLNASTSGIADADGLDNATFTYQWLSGQDPIADATAASYTLTPAEGGRQVAVRVTFTDDAGNAESLTSEPTAAVELEPNSPASGQLRVTGSALLHATLSVDTSAIADANGLSTASFSYQWLVTVDGTDQEIAGATAATFQVRNAQEGRPIKVRVSFTDDGGYTETLTSPALEPSQPTDLTASISDGAIVLSWQAPSNFPYLYEYRIQRERPESDESDSDLTVDTRSTVTSYRDSQVEAGVLYRYRVQAGNYWGQRSQASAPVEIRVPQQTTSEPALSPGKPTTLTAEFLDTPSFHDGQTAFTFELRFSEEFELSYETLRDHAFTVTGGEVDGARRLDRDSATPNIRWEITVAPDGNGDVTVVLPATTDCTAQGAICTGDGKMLSGEASVTVAGPEGEEQQTPPENNPATGAPAISGTARVGETLTADTSGIADSDGTGDAAFAYQWLADDTDISGATASSYTLVDSDEGKAIKVRVSFTDDAGNAESLTSSATAAVGAAPAPLTAEFLDTPSSHDGQTAFTFELRFSEEFELSYKTLRDHAFTVTGGEVTKARRLDRESTTPNIRWEITVTPDGNGSVTVALPATTDCAAQGTICTGDGRMLSNRTELTVSGPGG